MLDMHHGDAAVAVGDVVDPAPRSWPGRLEDLPGRIHIAALLSEAEHHHEARLNGKVAEEPGGAPGRDLGTRGALPIKDGALKSGD